MLGLFVNTEVERIRW